MFNSDFLWFMSLHSGLNVEKGFVNWSCILVDFLLGDEGLSGETELVAVFDIND